MPRISKTQLQKLQKKYKTDEAIGNLFGISRQAVHQIRMKYDIPPVEDIHDERNSQIRQLYKNGIAGVKLAKKFKLSLSQIYRIVRKK